MNAAEFRKYCHDYFDEHTTAKHPLIEYLAAGRGTNEQWVMYNKGLFYRGRSFHTHVALLSLHLDFPRTIALYKLLGDEGGGSWVGNVEKSHGAILAKFMTGYLRCRRPTPRRRPSSWSRSTCSTGSSARRRTRIRRGASPTSSAWSSRPSSR